VIQKHRLVNTLFLLGFVTYGLGSYMMFMPGYSWTTGLIFGTLPFVAILLFYLLDLLYRGSFTPVLNSTFLICLAAVLSLVASLAVGLHNHSPVLKMSNASAMALEFSVPFLAAVVVQVYNLRRDEFDWAAMLLKGLLLLELINLLGMGAGLHNKLHSFEGRASFPFVLGIYEAAHLLAIINLLLLFQLRDFTARPLRFMGILALYMLNLAIIMSVNSRLSFMIFFVITALFLTKAVKAAKGMFTISLFTMPLMMSFGLLIYQILSLPFFVALLERVDKKDVTTFNGRTYIWESAFDWALFDRRNIVFGNGFNGQYRLRMLDDVAKLWGEPDSYNLHMHSAFLEFFVNQGIVGLMLMYIVYWQGFKRYRADYQAKTAMAPLFAAFVYLMFCWQIDITGFGYNLGFLFLMMMMAPLCIRPEAVLGKRKALNGEWLKH
jgi:O-antigen ligase